MAASAFRLPTQLLRTALPSPTIRRFTTSTPTALWREVRTPYDPHAAAASKKRLAAALARKAGEKEHRESIAADPVMGRGTTPFLATIDEIPAALAPLDLNDPAVGSPRLNHYLKPSEIPEFLESSRSLMQPEKDEHDPYATEETVTDAFEARHEHAVEAIRRIVALGTGSNADKTQANIQHCIETFGRHNTDKTLPIDPGDVTRMGLTNKTPRAGPDTGSSEVQAAVLTAKIRALQHMMESMGALNKDKHNKRNLRLLVHKRQKILRYLKKKEKGGIRYRNVVEALGLDEDAIQNELFL